MKILQIWLCLVLGVAGTSVLAAGPEAVVQTLEKSVSRASKTGAAAKKWQEERGILIQELLDLELKDAWTRFQLEKMERFIASEQKNIAVLEENLAQARKTRNTLEPFLEVLYLDLEHHVRGDLPFSGQERDRRLAFIRSCLDDADARLPDKFGRILDALQVECDYGYSVAVSQEIVQDADGKPSQVTLLRLGRLGLFRVFAGSRGIQRFQKDTGVWEDILKTDMGEFKKTMEIALKKRVTTVVELPVGSSAGSSLGRTGKGEPL
jgi:hypothetical protein